MASTHSPTSRFSDRPKRTFGKPSASTFSRAKSDRLSAPMTSACSSRRSLKRTKISSASSTTWLLVRM